MTKSSRLPAWDLTDLFASPRDPNIFKSLKKTLDSAQRFEKKWKGKIQKLSAPRMAIMLTEYQQLLNATWKPEIYASLVHASDAKTPAHGKLLQQTRAGGTAIAKHLLFVELEIAHLGLSRIKKLAKEKPLAPLRHWLELQAEYATHRLSESEEQILNELSLTGRSAFIRLFDEQLSLKEFAIPPSKEKFSEAQILSMLHDSDRKTRKNAAQGFTTGLQDLAHPLTVITNTLLQEKSTMDRLRKFPTPEASRHLANETTQEMVDLMVQTVEASAPLVARYYQLKRKTLKLDSLYDFDRYAPIGEVKKKIEFAEARKIVLHAFHSFSPKLSTLAQSFFDKGWIDANARPGKRSGAFCSFVTPDLHPYVFVNYNHGTNDVMTLAHELGHGVHACLMKKQSLLHFDVPLTVAETASVFSEMLVFDQLKEQLTGKERFAFIAKKIESIFATVHRQTVMYRFEKELHETFQKNGELDTPSINAIWRSTQEAMFGGSVKLTKDYDSWWMYITHFIHSPFYVYAYAFGELLTLALFEEYKKQGPAMAKTYIEMLEKGGSVSPQDLVTPFGFSLNDPKFWNRGIQAIERLIEELESL